MLTKDGEHKARPSLIGPLILLLGVAIGFLLPRSAREAKETLPINRVQLAPVLKHDGASEQAPSNGLLTIEFEIPEDSARVLQMTRDQAIAKGIIIKPEGDGLVPARVTFAGDTLKAKIRIKGDWVDHVDSDRWSLRVELSKGSVLGMRRFSVQHPKTRRYLWEWLIHRAAEGEGILRPRSEFVNVIINGHSNGIYFLEEHTAKELLESQGRREGPIVRFDESSLWSSRVQNHVAYRTAFPPGAIRQTKFETARPTAYGMKRLSEVDSLARQLEHGINQLIDLQDLVLASSTQVDRIRSLRALENLRGTTIDALVDPVAVGKFHALLSVFAASHGAVWHNMRYYHNPVTDRLEPILFDTDAGSAMLDPLVPWLDDSLIEEFRHSVAYQVEAFAQLGRMTEPGWLESLFEKHRDELVNIEQALLAESALLPIFTLEALRDDLARSVIEKRPLVTPRAAASFMAHIVIDESVTDRKAGRIEVEAWAASRVPILVEGFRFSNGRVVSARDAFVSDEYGRRLIQERGSVCLPLSGERAQFSFGADERLINLGDVAQIKQAVRGGSSIADNAATGIDLDLVVLYRPASETRVREQKLVLRKVVDAWTATSQGRPEPPSLEEALAAHPYLTYDVDTDQLSFDGHRIDVVGDLSLPRGMSLRVAAGTTVRFEPDALLITDSPLLLMGTPNLPVVFVPVDGKSWGGILVLEAKETSIWKHVRISDTTGSSRGGWVLTGAVTFYRSDVRMEHVQFARNTAEDFLNIVSADFDLRSVTMSEFSSDGFDGDFVTGTVRGCRFEAGEGDAVDFSGCRVSIMQSDFRGIVDKAISIGEAGYAEVRGCTIENVGIGVAAKDGSTIVIERCAVNKFQHYGMAAYNKKAVYGPANLEANGVLVEPTGLGQYLIQTGCRLTVDGEEQPTEDIDVKQLYKDKILGT